MKARARIAASCGRIAFGFLVLLGTGCPDEGLPCGGSDLVTVKMTGTCAPGLRTFEIRQYNCAISLGSAPSMTGSDAGAPAPIGLPLRGEANMSGAPVRRGGWSIWGCLDGRQEPCPDQFRICTTERVAFQLNLTCVDSQGAPACEAVLTE